MYPQGFGLTFLDEDVPVIDIFTPGAARTAL
jgi:hypothetical protein